MRNVFGIAILMALLPLQAYATGLEHVKQTVFGMDCAPCAYGVEKGLKGLSGARDVVVSLNEGFAEIQFDADAQATIAQIRDVIAKSGFTPRDTLVQVSGIVKRTTTGGQLLLVVGSETFELDAEDDELLSRLAREAGSPATVSGTVSAESVSRLSVSAVR